MSGSFSLGGTNLATLGIHLKRDWLRPVLPAARAELIKIAGLHGGHDLGSQYDPRRFVLDCYIVAASHAQLLSRLQTLAGMLDIDLGYQELIFDDLTDRYWLAKLDGDIPEKGDAFGGDIVIPLVCIPPFALSTSLTESPHTIESDPDSFNEAVGGNTLTDPIYELDPSVGIDGLVKLENVTGDQELQWMGTLAASGEKLRIDVARMYVEKYASGAWSSSMAAVSGPFPRLRGGVTNIVKVTGISAGALKITYRDRYL